MKSTCSFLFIYMTALFFVFCFSIIIPQSSSANSSKNNALNKSTGSTDQSFSGHVASLKGEFKSKEEWLKACVAQASQVNYELAVYNKGLGCKLADTKKEIETVKKKIKESDVRAAKLKETQEEVDRVLSWSNKKLEAARREVEAQQYVAAEAAKSQKNEYATKLKKEVKTLKANIAEMEKKSKTFASLSASLNAPQPTKKKTK